MKPTLIQFLITLGAIILALIAYDYVKRPEVAAAKAQVEALKQQAEALSHQTREQADAMKQQAEAMKQQTEALGDQTKAQTETLKQQADALSEQAIALKNEVDSEHRAAEEEKQRHITAAYLTEGLVAAGSAKVSIAESYQNTGKLPASNREAGLADAAQFRGQSLSRLDVSAGGIITLTYDEKSGIKDGKIRLIPDTGNSPMGIRWHCVSPSYANVAQTIPQCAYQAPKDS